MTQVVNTQTINPNTDFNGFELSLEKPLKHFERYEVVCGRAMFKNGWYFPHNCLLVKRDWVRGIFSGAKTCEVRNGCGFPLDTWIGIVESKTSICYGMVQFSHSTHISNSAEWCVFWDNHRVDNDFSDVKYKNPYLWHIGKVKRFAYPFTVERKRGQVVWIKNPIVLREFHGTERAQLLTNFYTECLEWTRKQHFI